jgi:hypothetical protein
VNVERPQTLGHQPKRGAIIAAVEWEVTRYNARIGTIPQPWVLEVHHDDQLHPQHYYRNVYLLPDDQYLRMRFCERLQPQRTAGGSFLYNIQWIGEACSKHDGAFNVHKEKIFMLYSNVGIKTALDLTFGLKSSDTLSWAISAARKDYY